MKMVIKKMEFVAFKRDIKKLLLVFEGLKMFCKWNTWAELQEDDLMSVKSFWWGKKKKWEEFCGKFKVKGWKWKFLGGKFWKFVLMLQVENQENFKENWENFLRVFHKKLNFPEKKINFFFWKNCKFSGKIFNQFKKIWNFPPSIFH